LSGYQMLSVLVLDENIITLEQERLPFLPSLTEFSVASNALNNVETFMDNCSASLPQLAILNTLGNPMNPTGTGMKHHVYNYRIYCISRLPSLRTLDHIDVTLEEYKHSKSIQ